MSDINEVWIEGRLVKAAELSYFPDGTPYANFTIGNNETYKKADGEYESIGSFFDCVLKGQYAASMAKYLLKGRSVYVVGRLKQSKWEKDGQKFSRVVIKVEKLRLGNEAASTGNSTPPQQQNYQNNNQTAGYQQNEPVEDQYIPFDETGLSEDIPF